MREVCAERLGAAGHEAHGPHAQPLRILAQRLREWELEGDGSRVGSPREAPQRRHQQQLEADHHRERVAR